jgi:hypothetical protein
MVFIKLVMGWIKYFIQKVGPTVTTLKSQALMFRPPNPERFKAVLCEIEAIIFWLTSPVAILISLA